MFGNTGSSQCTLDGYPVVVFIRGGRSTPIDIASTDYAACGDETISLLRVGLIAAGGSG